VATLLDEALISDTLQSLPGWHGDTTRLWRDVKLEPALDAELRRQIGIDAGAMGHDPSYEKGKGTTRIVLRTADEGGVTEFDVVMASHISDLVHRLSSAEPGVSAVRRDEAVAIFRAGESASGEDDEAPGPPVAGGDNTALFEPDR
jgi:4a-hydroxytetrahydrobiopterin dehydratase